MELIGNDVTPEVDHYDVTTHHENHTFETKCGSFAPNSAKLLSSLGTEQILLLVTMMGLTIATLCIYIEEVVFVMKTFRISERRKKTIWVLAFFPVFSVCSIIAMMVPKSGPLVHMCANVFFCTCLYQILRLTVSYMGGMKRIWTVVEKDRQIQLNTMPLCCCCPCCPRPQFTRENFIKINLLVMQIAIVRPIVLFISAVLWTDGLHENVHNQIYTPGVFSPMRSFLWLSIINVVSTCLAVYGLVMTNKVLEPELEKEFLIRGKIVSIQGTLIMTVIPNIIIGGLVSGGVISCSEMFSAKVRGEEIYFGILIIIMLPFSLLGRRNFRRASDGNNYAVSNHGDGINQPIKTQNGDHVVELKVLLADDEKKVGEDVKEKIANNNETA